MLSRLHGEGNWQAYRGVFLSDLAINGILAAFVVLLTTLFATELMSIYGPNFTDSANLVRLLMISVIPELIAMALFLHVQAHERLWVSFFGVLLPKDVIFMVGTWLSVKAGIAGVALAYGLSWFFAALAFGLIAFRIGFSRPERRSA